MGARISRTWAFGLILFGGFAGGFLIDLDHPLQATLQGKSVFDWTIPHGRFLHIPILILSSVLVIHSVAFLLGRLLTERRHVHLN